ncbi:MAG: M56 family metallopeptidase [Thermoguttaceae bacterium]
MTTRLIAWLDQWAGPIALQVAVAATMMLVVALLVSWTLRRSAASLRHRVWALAILGLLAYPLVQPLLPKVSLGLRIASPEHPSDAGPTATNPSESPSFAHTVLPAQDRRLVDEIATHTNQSTVPLPVPKPQAGEEGGIRLSVAEALTRASTLHWPSILAALWAIGTVIGLGFLVNVHLTAFRLVRTATEPSDPSWSETAGVLTAQLGIRRRVAVRISDWIAVPVTAGWLRPVILMPTECDRWTGSRRRMVLIHELSHVARGDVLWQIAAKLACVIYWPHPLVWLAARRMRVEREAACDDAVLRDVERPSEYASLLLDVAASLADRPIGMGTAAVAMACGRSVEERIRWIVQPGRCRLPISRRTARWFSVGAVLIVLGLGSISLFAGPPVTTASEPTTNQKQLSEKTPPVATKQTERTGVSEHAEMAKPVLRQQAQQPAPPELVKKLLEANRYWLRPDPKYLSYMFSMEHPGRNDHTKTKVEYTAPHQVTVQADNRPPYKGLIHDGHNPFLNLLASPYPEGRQALLQGVYLFGPLQDLAVSQSGYTLSVVGEEMIDGIETLVLHLRNHGRPDQTAILLWDAELRRQATKDQHFDEESYNRLKAKSGEPKPLLPMCVGCGVFGTQYGGSNSHDTDVDQLWVEKVTGRILREEGFYEADPRFVVTYSDFERTPDNGQVPSHIVVRLLGSPLEKDDRRSSTYPWVFDMKFQLLDGNTWLLKELKEAQGERQDVAIAAVTNVSVSPPGDPPTHSSSTSASPDEQAINGATKDTGPPSKSQPSNAKLSPATTAEKTHQSQGPILRGRIIDESGNPLPGIRVVLYSGIATRFRGQEAKTNANGEYQFDPMKTGAAKLRDGRPSDWYTGVQFEHDEYVPADGRSWRDIQVPMVDRHEHVVDMKMVRGGKVSGIVLDADTGKPAGQLDLRIDNGFIGGKRDGEFTVYATTDNVGRFTSRPLFPGRYVIQTNDAKIANDAKIGMAVVRAGETTEMRMTTQERPDLQDPFRITGTAIGDDGHSMVYGGVGLRITGSDNKLRTAGGGIDGRNVFNLNFGPIERITTSPKAPYGVGTYDVEFFGWNTRFGYKLVKRTPSEPLRITDDQNQPELKDGIRYIRPNQPAEFQLVFTKDDTPQRQSSENASTGTVLPEGKTVAPVPIVLEQKGAKSIECRAIDAITGKPVAGAVVKIVVRQLKDEKGQHSYREIETSTTDADSQGQFTVVVPQKYLTESDSKREVDLFVTASHAGYVTGFGFGFPRRIVLEGVTDNSADFRLIKLEPAKEIYGQAVDAQGRPLAETPVYKNYYDARMGHNSAPLTQTRDADNPIKTDREGRFRTKVATRAPLDLEFRTLGAARNYWSVPPDRTDLGVIRLPDGVRVTGRVLDAQNQPVQGITVNAPLQSKTESQPNVCYSTDDSGRFTTDKLSPGDYLFTVGQIYDRRHSASLSPIADAPGVYISQLLKIRAGEPVAELTLRPTKDVVRCAATLISTRPQPALDKQTEPISLGDETGRKLLAELFLSNPTIMVRGLVHDNAWDGRAPSIGGALYVDDEAKEPSKASSPENSCSLVVPKELVDVTMDFGMCLQHFQLDDKSSKLFGFGIHLDRIDHDLANIKIYRYRETKLNVHVKVPEGKPLAGVQVQARYVREKAMREAGAILMSGIVPFLKPEGKGGDVSYSVLPGEEIDVWVTVPGLMTAITPRVQLKDGEVRTLNMTPTAGE